MSDSHAFRSTPRTAPCPTVAGTSPLRLIRIGYGLTVLSSLLAFAMRAS